MTEPDVPKEDQAEFACILKFPDIQMSNQRTNRTLSTDEAEPLTRAAAPLVS